MSKVELKVRCDEFNKEYYDDYGSYKYQMYDISQLCQIIFEKVKEFSLVRSIKTVSQPKHIYNVVFSVNNEADKCKVISQILSTFYTDAEIRKGFTIIKLK